MGVIIWTVPNPGSQHAPGWLNSTRDLFLLWNEESKMNHSARVAKGD